MIAATQLSGRFRYKWVYDSRCTNDAPKSRIREISQGISPFHTDAEKYAFPRKCKPHVNQNRRGGKDIDFLIRVTMACLGCAACVYFPLLTSSGMKNIAGK